MTFSHRFRDLAGQQFNQLTVISYAEKIITKNASRFMWNCVCVCGKGKVVSGDNLKSGGTKSCGCYQKAKLIAQNTTHNLSGTREHNSWRCMLNRCANPSDKYYKRYGERGIKVCERWKLFENFYSDMGKRPDRHTIERINNDGNYEPSNCKWATAKEQANNKTQRKAA